MSLLWDVQAEPGPPAAFGHVTTACFCTATRLYCRTLGARAHSLFKGRLNSQQLHLKKKQLYSHFVLMNLILFLLHLNQSFATS